jgi:hypothetical protein
MKTFHAPRRRRNMAAPTGAPMIHYDYYADVPDDVVDTFVRERELGRLVTVSAAGVPHIGLYPFVYEPRVVELHLHRDDEQLADLATHPRCLFEVDDVLGVVPSYWVHAESAVAATAYHRTVILECAATISRDGRGLAAQQMRLMSRYQPEGGFRTVDPDDELYRSAIGHITAIRLDVLDRRVKFKLAQNRPVTVRERVVARLRERGRPNDARAAEAIQWTIERERR